MPKGRRKTEAQPPQFTSRRFGMTTAETRARVAAYVREGLPNWKIAERLRMSERTVERYRQRNRQGDSPTAGNLVDAPEPKSRDELLPEVQATLEDTPEGFERFFNRYSGLKLARHSKRFVQSCFVYECGCDPANGVHDPSRRHRHFGRWKLRVLILVPPSHAKTSVFSTWMRIWRICQSRDFRSLIISETGELAVQIAREIALELDENPELVEDFGRFRSDQPNVFWQPGKGAVKVEGATFRRGYSVLARGAGTQIQGLRTDEMVIDDLIGPENVLTEDRREKTSWWLRTVVISRVDPGTRIFVIATKQHLYDIYSELEAQRTPEDLPAWEVVKFPAILDPATKEVLWPEERPWSFLEREVIPHMTTAAFEMTYQQNPLPSGERVFKPDWFYGLDTDTNPNKGCLDRGRLWGKRDVEEGWVRVVTVDPSPSNYWAIVVADVKAGAEEFSCRVLEIVRAKLNVATFLEHMERLAVAYSPRYIVPEKNSANLFILQSMDWRNFEVRHQGMFRVLPHETQRNRSDPKYGLESLALDFEVGRIRLPYADIESISQSQLLIKEALDYPHGRTDDVLLALWFAKANMQSFYGPRRASVDPGRGFHVPAHLRRQRWVKVSAGRG